MTLKLLGLMNPLMVIKKEDVETSSFFYMRKFKLF